MKGQLKMNEEETPNQEQTGSPPVQDISVMDVKPSQDTSAVKSDEPTPEKSVSDGLPERPDPVQVPELNKPKRGAPVITIVVAIIVALGLAGLAVFAYMKTNETKKTPESNQPVSPAAAENVTTQDVEEVDSQTEADLNSVDEATDFPETDLSDQSLEL